MKRTLLWKRALPVLGLFVLALLFFVAVRDAQAATLTVCPSGCDHTSVQDAIDAAASGDLIEIGPGTYAEHLLIEKNLTLRGAGTAATTLTKGSGEEGRVVTILGDAVVVVIEDLTITGGRTVMGAVIGAGAYDRGYGSDITVNAIGLAMDFPTSVAPFMRDFIVPPPEVVCPTVGSPVAPGEFVYCAEVDVVAQATDPALTASNITSNLDVNPGPSVATSFLWLLARGGGVFNEGDLTLNRVLIDDNQIQLSAISDVVALDQQSATAEIDHEVRALGAGLYNGGTARLYQSTVSNNSVLLSSEGMAGAEIEAIDGRSADPRPNPLEETLVEAHVDLLTTAAGGIYNAGIMTIDSSTVDHNSATVNNLADAAAFDVTPVLRAADVANQEAVTNLLAAGGILNNGDLNVVNSTVSNNAIAQQFSGLTGSTHDLNAGGGIFNASVSALLFTTVAENSLSYPTSLTHTGTRASGVASASVPFDYFDEDIPPFGIPLRSSRPRDSQPRNGGTELELTATVLGSNNLNSVDCAVDLSTSSLVLIGENFASDGTCFLNTGNLNLGPLGDNGGPTETHALLPGSVAIDSNSSGMCSLVRTATIFDQRGESRPINIPGVGSDLSDLCDAGAYEVQLATSACPVIITRGGTGTVDYRMSDIVGNGMGDNRRFRTAARIVIPDYAHVVALYGQMAGKGPTYTSNKVRFISPDGSRADDFVQNSPAYQLGAIHWYGVGLDAAELSQGPNSLKGKMRSRWFLTSEGRRMRTPRAVLYYPTYETDELYADVVMLFDDSSLNHVAWEAGYTPTQDFAIDIPTTQLPVNLLVKLAIVGMDRDPRQVLLEVEAGGVVVPLELTVPTNNPSLNILEVELPLVPAGTSVVNIHMESPAVGPDHPAGGDSAALVGATVNYACGVGDGK